MRRRNSGGLKTPLIFCTLAVIVASFFLNFFHPSLVPSASAKLSDTLCHSLSGCSKDGYVAYLADPNGEAVEYGSTPFRVFLGSGSETYINIDNQDGLVGITFSDTAGGSGPGYTVTPLTGNLSGYKLYIFKASSTLDYTGDEFGTAASTISKLHNKGIDPVATYSLSEDTRTILATKDGNSFKFVATSASGENTEEIVTEEEPSSGSSSEAEADTSCSSSASGLGWILCPAANFLNSVLSTFYGWMEQFMQINPGLFTVTSDSGESGIHSGWSIFRDIANVFFVIYILVMIISQVTGVGISNYGIKKNLPRVIVSAILINISYYLCVLAVDVSNIVGASIKDLFVSFSATITVQQTGIFAGMTGVDIATGIGGLSVLTAAGVGYLITQGATSITSGVALAGAGLLMGLISVLISAAIGVIGMFLVLAVRQGLVVICTVIAPLAIIAYTLPNTKNLYDRWWKIAKALILMYPICGFVIGAGAFASRIILSTGDDFWTVLIAAVVQVGPYFALPSLIRGSINAVGSLGNRIGKLAGGYDRAAQGAFRNAPGLRRITAYQGSRRMAFQRKRDEYFRNRSYGYLQQSDAELQEAGRKARLKDAQETVTDLGGRQAAGGILTAVEKDRLARAQQEIATQDAFNRGLERKASAEFWESQQRNAEKRESEMELAGAISNLFDQGGYAYGKDFETMTDDAIALLNQNNLSDAERTKAHALVQTLMMTKGGEGVLINALYGLDASGSTRPTTGTRFTNTGLKNFNSIFQKDQRMQGIMATEDGNLGLLLGDLAKMESQGQTTYSTRAGNVSYDTLTNTGGPDFSTIGEAYTGATLKDTQKIAAASGDTLNRYKDYISADVAAASLNPNANVAPNKQTIVSQGAKYLNEVQNQTEYSERIKLETTIKNQITASGATTDYSAGAAGLAPNPGLTNGYNLPSNLIPTQPQWSSRPDGATTAIVRDTNNNNEVQRVNLQTGDVEVQKQQVIGAAKYNGFAVPITQKHDLSIMSSATFSGPAPRDAKIDISTAKYDLTSGMLDFRLLDANGGHIKDAMGSRVGIQFNTHNGEWVRV